MNVQNFISDYIEKRKDTFTQLSDQLWQVPEIAFEEVQSAAYLCQALEAEGFHVEKDVAVKRHLSQALAAEPLSSLF